MCCQDLYQELGGFDETMYSDDVDLSRMLLKENRTYYYHETTVIHYKGESTVKDGIYMKRFQESMQFFRFFLIKQFSFVKKCFRVKPKKNT
jgi:GT2 family glycosyltransferase